MKKGEVEMTDKRMERGDGMSEGEHGNCAECGKEVIFTRTGKHCRECVEVTA